MVKLTSLQNAFAYQDSIYAKLASPMAQQLEKIGAIINQEAVGSLTSKFQKMSNQMNASIKEMLVASSLESLSSTIASIDSYSNQLNDSLGLVTASVIQATSAINSYSEPIIANKKLMASSMQSLESNLVQTQSLIQTSNISDSLLAIQEAFETVKDMSPEDEIPEEIIDSVNEAAFSITDYIYDETVADEINVCLPEEIENEKNILTVENFLNFIAILFTCLNLLQSFEILPNPRQDKSDAIVEENTEKIDENNKLYEEMNELLKQVVNQPEDE